MSEKTFYSAPCLSDSIQPIKRKDLWIVFKGADRRYLSQTLHKFIKYNQDAFNFLGITPSVFGIDPEVELSFVTSRYIGAIPLRTAVNGKQIGDFIVRPRFSDDRFLFEHLTKILMMLKENIEPEYLDSIPLASGELVRPPRYYEALKYITAFETGIRTHWHKFRSTEKSHSFPKSSTLWLEYIENDYDISKRLTFPARDNELSKDHLEWKQAKMVFEYAKEEINRPSTPLTIRLKSKTLLETLAIKTKEIDPASVRTFKIHSFDPKPIQTMKDQGNKFLNASTKEVCAWRMDIAELFEKYVQHLVQVILRDFPVKFIKNPRFPSSGKLPSWGLKHLEPDALIEADNMSIAIDAKYKVHYYSRNQTSSILKETHRDDLHQILSYCSFSTSKNKVGILFYPANEFSHNGFSYSNQYNGTLTQVIIVGLPFEPDIKSKTTQGLTNLFGTILRPDTT